MTDNKSVLKMLWGIVLILVGLGVFYRIPQVMPKIETIEQFASISWFIRFCFYFIGILLLVAGLKRCYDSYQRLKGKGPKT
jgi:sulfite exporter TauE/SafE